MNVGKPLYFLIAVFFSLALPLNAAFQYEKDELGIVEKKQDQTDENSKENKGPLFKEYHGSHISSPGLKIHSNFCLKLSHHFNSKTSTIVDSHSQPFTTVKLVKILNTRINPHQAP